MAINVGDRLPEATLRRFAGGGMQTVSVTDLTKGKKVVLFAVPGAFTPTCSEKHLPGFVQHAADFAQKGIDKIVCLAVNDPFVMSAWEKANKADGRIEFLSDGNGELTKAMGLDFDASAVGLGTRSRRYAMLVEDGVVKILLIEDVPSQAEKSSAAALLATL
jgi:peroxiredoxin